MTVSFLEAQLGFGVESVYGTRVAPTLFLPFKSEALVHEKDYLQSASYRSGRTTLALRRPGARRSKGPITMELAPQGLNRILKHCMGAIATTGSGPYVHTITPGPMNGLSLSAQIVRTSQAGAQVPFDYSGLKVQDWTIGCQVGQIAELAMTMYGTVEDTTQTVATPSLPSGLLPFTYVEGDITIDGDPVDVKSFSLKGDNGLLVDRQRISATTPEYSREPVAQNLTQFTGTLDADFTDLTAYQRYLDQDQVPLVITLQQAGGHELQITLSVEFDGTTANAAGMGSEPRQMLPFTGVSPTSDADVCTMVLTNSTATP